MRVLLVADIVGGVRTFVSELARELPRLGVELDLALIGPGSLGDLPVRSVEVRELRLEWMTEPWQDFEATADWVAELVARRQPDVVHMNTFASVRAPVPVLLTVHSCVLTWWRAVHGESAPADWERYRAVARAALDRADRLVVPTRALLSALREVYGDLPPAEVVMNGLGPLECPDGERERLVVSVGRLWDEAKNVRGVAQAAQMIDGRVVVIGPGEVEGVESLGPLPGEEVLDWLRRAVVFVEPARYEPFGLAALEAALCGCALVLGDIPSLREVWGEAALYVAPDDPRALAAVVQRLLDDERARRVWSLSARAHAARYTASAMAQRYLAAYRRASRVPVAA